MVNRDKEMVGEVELVGDNYKNQYKKFINLPHFEHDRNMVERSEFYSGDFVETFLKDDEVKTIILSL